MVHGTYALDTLSFTVLYMLPNHRMKEHKQLKFEGVRGVVGNEVGEFLRIYIEKKLNLEFLGGPSGTAHVKDVNARDTITAHGMCIIRTKIAMQT